MSLNGYSWVEGNTPNATDPSGMSCRFGRSADNVVSECGTGCTTFWAGVNSVSLQDFMTCNPTISNEREAASLLLLSLKGCGCEDFRMYNVESKSDPRFFELYSRLLNRKDRLRKLVETSQCGSSLWDTLYTDMIDSIDPSTCYSKYTLGPTVGQINECINSNFFFPVCTRPETCGANLARHHANLVKMCLGEKDFITVGFGCGNVELISIALDVAGFFPATAPMAAVVSITLAAFKLIAFPDDPSSTVGFSRALSSAGSVVGTELGKLGGEIYDVVLNRISQLNAGFDIIENVKSILDNCFAPIVGAAS